MLILFNKLRYNYIDKYQDSTEVLPILGVLEWVFSLGENFAKT